MSQKTYIPKNSYLKCVDGDKAYAIRIRKFLEPWFLLLRLDVPDKVVIEKVRPNHNCYRSKPLINLN